LNKLNINGCFEELTVSRCKPWDDRELDLLEGFKVISMTLLIFNYTAFFQMSASIWNPWEILDMFDMWSIGVVVSANVALEIFFTLSAFI